MRIVIGGPKHSGKSVFLYDLKKHLPIGSYMPIRAAPDGEGDWTQELYQVKSAKIESLRKKGTFDPAFVEWAAQSAKNCTSRFGLIDAGGRVSAENRRICKDADAIIVLSSDPKQIQDWLDFAAELRLRVLAILHSTLEPVLERWEVRDHVFKGTVVGLDRETFQGSQTIKALVQFLLEEVPETQEISTSDTLTIAQIASIIGKQEENYVLAGGRQMYGLNWRPEELPLVLEKIKPFSEPRAPRRIDGPAPQWLIACLLEALFPCPLILKDTKVKGEEVSIGQHKRPVPGGKGELTYEVKDLGDLVYVHYESNKPLDAASLPDLIPPTVPSGKPVLLNGRTSNWGLAEIVSCYLHVVPAIYVGQAVDEYIYVCAVSHSPAYQLSHVIREEDLPNLNNV